MWTVSKRIFLFIAVNILVLITLAVSFNVLLTFFGYPTGFDSLVWFWYGMIGFGGAFVALALSRKMAKWTLGVRVIPPSTVNPDERRLVETVHALSSRAGLKVMPEVGIYDRPEVNAFATGPTKSRALVAVSTGLLKQMDQQGLEGVIGHEVAHIANGDMVTMTLLQGVINTLVLIAARVVAVVVSSMVDRRARAGVYILVFYILQILLSVLGSLVVCYFSRRREFRADDGGARLAGRERMLAGLNSLRGVYGHVDDEHQALAALKISGHSTRTLARLFATHPPLEERLRRLEAAAS